MPTPRLLPTPKTLATLGATARQMVGPVQVGQVLVGRVQVGRVLVGRVSGRNAATAAQAILPQTGGLAGEIPINHRLKRQLCFT